MQCLAGAILAILLIQNSLGQNEEDPGCAEKPGALVNYMRRLNDAENETERPEDPENSEDSNDPKSRMGGMFSYQSQSYYPHMSHGRQEYNIIPSAGWTVPSFGGGSSSSIFISSGMNMKTTSHTIKYKVNIPMDDLFNRFFKLYAEWPQLKTTLDMRHAFSFREVLRAAFDCMYPEWGTMKMNMIFSGIHDEDVLKDLFIAMFPNWPQQQINDIFSPGNTIPLIIRKLLLYLVPDMSQQEINYIFSNTNSVTLILQRIWQILFPGMNDSGHTLNFDNSVTNIFDGLFKVFFPQMSEPSPMQWDTVYTVMFPEIRYNVTSYESYLPFLLMQYENSRIRPIEPSKRENILLLILVEWLKMIPNVKYVLISPGRDDFLHFKITLFQNVPPNTRVPPEFRDDNLLRELYALWTRYVVGRYPNDRQIDLPSILEYLLKLIQSHIINNNPNIPPNPTTPYPPATTTVQPTLDDIPIIITITFLENLRDILPMYIRTPLIELLRLPDKTKSGPLIIRILSEWQKYQLKNRVPLSKLMELILRIIASNWPNADVQRVVGRNLTFEQIVINLFKVMFLEWPNIRLEGKINSPQFILEMVLKKALPHIPKKKIEVAVGGPNNIEWVVRRLLRMLFPDWPMYNPSNMYFDLNILEKIISEIINWPRTKSTITEKGAISIPLLVESFIRAIFPSWPQYVVSMITVGRVPLPLLVQKTIQLIAAKHEDSQLVFHFNEQSTMVYISEGLFRMIFPNWPNDKAVLNIPIRRERVLVLGELLQTVRGQIAKHENNFICLNDPGSNWAYALFIGLMNYVEQESIHP